MLADLRQCFFTVNAQPLSKHWRQSSHARLDARASARMSEHLSDLIGPGQLSGLFGQQSETGLAAWTFGQNVFFHIPGMMLD